MEPSKKRSQTVIEDYKENWDQLQSNLPGHFYVIRDRFNKAPNPLDLSFLMRTCVNGIVRFNKDGLFNNSFHLSRKGMLPEMFSRNVKAWNIVIKDIEFVCQDYAITLEQATKDDFIYLDPPYSCNKQRYVQDLDVDRLWSELNRLNSIGVKWALSFDGSRGTDNYEYDIPRELYKYSLMIKSGNSAVDKVLNGPIKEVHERLYLNYTI